MYIHAYMCTHSQLTHLQLEASISKANKDTIRNSAGNNSGDEDEDEEDDENSSVFAEPLWIFGLFCVIFGSVLDLISFGFADMSLLAPLGAMTLVINMATAVWFLKEKLSKKDVLHTIIILLGTLLAVSFGSKAAPKYTLDMLFGMYMTKVFFVFECAYIGLLVCALLLLRRIHNVRENNQSFAQKKRETLDDLSLPSSDEDADADANTSEQTNIGIDSGLGGSYQNSGDGDPRQPAADTREQDDNDASSFLLEQGTRMESLLYPTIAGSFGAHSVLCAKSVAEIVRPIIDYISSSSTVGVSVSEGIDAVYAPLTNVFTYVLFVCMLGFLVLQVRFLNMGLAKADALLVVPIYQVSWVLMNCIVGFTYFQDYQAMSTFQIVMFSLAVFVILMGVYLLSTRPLTPHSMLLEEAMRDTEYNDLDINLRYECEYDYDEDEDDAQMDKEDAEAERAKEGGKHEEGSGSGVKGRDDGYDKGGIYVGGKDQMKNEREGHRVTRTERSTSTNTSEEARDEKIHGTDHDRDTGRGRRQSMAKDGMRQRLNSRTNTRGSDHDHGIDARADLQRTVRCVDGNASMNDKRTNDVLQASSYQSASIAGKGHGGAAITDDNVSVPSKTDDGEKDAEEPHKHQHTDKGESNSGTGLDNTESETVGTGQRTVVRDAHTDTNAVADTNHSADDEERDDGREEEAPCWRRYLCFFFNKRRKGYYAQRIQLMVHLIKLGMGAGMFSIPYLFHRLGIMMASFMVCVTLLMCSLSLRLILRTQQQVNFYTRFDFLHDAIKGKKNNGFVAMSKLVRLILGTSAHIWCIYVCLCV